MVQYVGKFLTRTLRAVGPMFNSSAVREVGAKRGRRIVPRLSDDAAPPEGTRDPVWFPKGGYRCIRCLRSGATLQILKAAQCKPGVGHRVWTVGQFVFCSVCGAYSEHNTQKLGHDCRGSCPRGSVSWDRLRKLWSGRHPRSGAELLGAGCGQRPTPFGSFALDHKFKGLEVLPGFEEEDEA